VRHILSRGKTTAIFIMAQNIANAVFQLMIVIMTARILGVESTGQYSLAQSYVLPAYFLGIFALKTQYSIARDNPDVGDYLAVRTFGGVAVFLLLTIVMYFLEEPLILEIGVSLAVVKLLDGYSDLLVAVFQRSPLPSLIMYLAILRLVLLSVTFFLVFIFTTNLVYALLFSGVIGLLNMLLVETRLCKKYSNFKTAVFTLKPRANKNRLDLATKGIPISFGLLVGTAQLSLVRIAVANYQDYITLGRFSATLQVILIGNLFIVAIGQSQMPKMANFFNLRNKLHFVNNLKMQVGFVLIYLALSSLVCYSLGDWVMTFIFGAEFDGLGNMLLMGIFASSSFFLNAIFTQAALACNLVKQQFLVYFFGLILAFILTLVISTSFAATEAYATLFLINIVQVFIFMWLINEKFRSEI
jgi:O-antigen/teichoic acid export membrane protein